jgi:hypothetical protein
MNSKGQRNDAWLPNCATGGCTGNTSITASALTSLAKGMSLLSATSATASASSVEDVEFSNWQAKLNSNTLKIGAEQKP